MDLDAIKAMLQKEVRYGHKLAEDDRLDFSLEPSTLLGTTAMDRYAQSRDLLSFYLEDSDRLAVEYGDRESTTLSRAAGNIAEIILKYERALGAWEKILADKEKAKKYADAKGEMQRFFGSHQSVTESFLIKLIAMTKGQDAARLFIESLPSKNGFGFSEGYSVVLDRDASGQPLAHVTYKDQIFDVTQDILHQMVADRDNMLAEIDKKEAE